ncbi:MAG: D-alanine--D-alanine ligase [Methanoregulaceae archaeon]|nr:D-alanine--D-alanine ligase [Methanoregulaceae archaeon]
MRTPWEIEHEFGPREALDDYRSFFLVGIGGASMSALALMLKDRGLAVCGSDSTASPVTAELMAAGIPVRIGHDGEGIKRGDAVILTDAIDLKTSPEVRRARELGCGLFRRSQLLGWLLKDRRIVAITGTHGKTTTTGLVSFALIEAGLDPLCVEGANLPQWGGPVREGEGEWAVIEACEAYNSLRDFDPEVVLLTNLELDHEDFYAEGWPQLERTMLAFVNRARVLVYCGEDAGAVRIAEKATCRTVPYQADSVELPELAILGATNRLNATGAFLAAIETGAEPEDLKRGLAQFTGAERRLQLIHDGEITVIDDYAHHPSEIIASIGALRTKYPGRRLVVVFQPHLYSRTAAHLADFATSLGLADLVVLTDIYPAREAPIPGVSSARIAEQLKGPCRYVPNRHLLPIEVARLAKPGDVVVGMGAGTISEFPTAFIAEVARSARKQTKVAVIYGGDSAEREVSILSGNAVCDALKQAGFGAFLVDVTEVLISKGDLSGFVGPNRPDVVFLAVHGTHAEDGAIQGLLELLHIPYTGSGIQSSALAMDKERAKMILSAHGLPVPRGWLVRSGDELPSLGAGKFIVKPNAQGSTVGVTFVNDSVELPGAVDRALQYDSAVLIEELIEGVEISVPVVGNRALPPVEILPTSGSYDFEAKYTPGATEEICPARLTPDVLAKAQEYAVRAHRALGCTGATRTDMIVREGEPVILEVNTLPGMTGTSLLPNSARVAGIEFPSLCAWMVNDALARAGFGVAQGVDA